MDRNAKMCLKEILHQKHENKTKFIIGIIYVYSHSEVGHVRPLLCLLLIQKEHDLGSLDCRVNITPCLLQ